MQRISAILLAALMVAGAVYAGVQLARTDLGATAAVQRQLAPAVGTPTPGGAPPAQATKTPQFNWSPPGTPTPEFGAPSPLQPRVGGSSAIATASPPAHPDRPLRVGVAAPAAVSGTGSISGKVTDKLGTPIAGASVWACCYVGYASTAADGTYTMSGVPVGSYQVVAFATGYGPVAYNDKYDLNAADLVTVVDGGNTVGIDLAMPAAAAVSGVITDPLGTPVAGASVQACPNSFWYCSGWVTTAVDGSYTISDLDGLSYYVVASAPGYLPTYYNGTTDSNAKILIPLTSGSTTTGISFKLVAAGAIAGVVKDALGTPVAGATVQAQQDACCGSGTTTTAGDGSYTITGLAPGNYRVFAQSAGYAPTFYNGAYDYSAATLVAVASGATTNAIDFALATEARIAGIVKNNLGTPVAGATVTACVSVIGFCGAAATAADGTYTVTGLAPGGYRVQVSASGYPTTYYNGVYDYNAATLVTASSGATTSGIDFALLPEAKIAGTVKNALGTPIAGASVYANLATGCCASSAATTAGDGTYTIVGVAPGNYRLQASATGYPTTYYNGVYDSSAATLVSATSGATTTGIDFALAAGATISGTVKNALGTPIAGAQVSAQASTGYGYATTSGDGTYTVTGLAPGSYVVGASAGGYAPTFYNGTYDYNSATQVPVTTGGAASGIDFALAPEAKISGTVKNALGTPIAGAQVQASLISCCVGRSTSTAGDGTYTITGLAPGSYQVQASATGYPATYYNGTYDYNAATAVPATSGATTTGIDFALQPEAKISGTVKNALGTPIAGAQVYASQSTCCGYASAVSAGDGTYTVTGLVPGTYRVQASAIGYPAMYYNGTYDYSAATLVSGSSGVTTTGIDFALEPGGSISGTVKNTLGTPIAGAVISASGPGCCGSATSAADGTYTIVGLVPGSYTVQAAAAGYAGRYYNNVYDYSAATLVPVTSGATATGIDFSLSPGGKIAGVIKDALGTPIAGALVQVSGGVCCVSATSAGDGSYTLSGVAPGSYPVFAQGGGYAGRYYKNTYDYGSAVPVVVTEGKTTTGIDFTLEPPGSIAGTVHNNLGTPIAGASVWAFGTCCGGGASTALDGTYSINGISPGNYTVQVNAPAPVSAPGYPLQYYNGVYDSGSATLVPVSSGTTTADIDFTVQPGGSISGKVTDESNNPIAGATVTANRTSCCVSGVVTAAGDGTFSITGLAPGSYTLSASAASFVPEYYDDKPDITSATPITVTLGADTPNRSFALAAAGTPATLALSAQYTGTVCDGHHGTTIQATVTDAGGHIVANGTNVTFAPGAHATAFPTAATTSFGSAWSFVQPLASAAPSGVDVVVSSGAASGTIHIDCLTFGDAAVEPITVPALPFSDARSTAGYTLEGGETQPCANIGATAWYKLTLRGSPPGGVIPLTVSTSGSSFNTALAVYTSTGFASSPPGSLTLVGCNAKGANSSVSFNASSPGVYYIQAGGAGAATGSLFMHVGCTGDTDCDGCGDAGEAALSLDPNDQWDFYSVPVPALYVAADPASDFRDHTTSAGDAQAVFAYFKAFAHIGTQVYNQDLNLNGIMDGIEYDRTSVGAHLSGAPDGVISAQDAQLAFSQFKAAYFC